MKKRTMFLIGAAALVVIAVATGEEEEAPKEVAQEVVAEEEATKETTKEEPKKEEASTTETEEESSEVEEVPTDVLGTVQMRPVMNGNETEKIGEFVYIASFKDVITEENLLSFFKNEAGKYEDANFLIIDLQDGTAFHGISGMPMLTYGAYDEEEETVVEQWETIIVDTDNGTVSGTLHEGVAADKAWFAK